MYLGPECMNESFWVGAKARNGVYLGLFGGPVIVLVMCCARKWGDLVAAIVLEPATICPSMAIVLQM